MSIFGKIKHGIHHATHKVEHAAEHAKHKADHAAEQAADQVQDGVDKAADAVKDAAKKAKEGIEKMDIAEEIKHEILEALKSGENAAVSAIKDAEKSATGELQKLGNEIKKEIEDEVAKIEQALEGKAAHEILSDLVDVIRALSPDSIQLELGPIQLGVGNLGDKVEDFVRWSKKPPNNRKTWIAFVQDITPDSLSLVQSIGLGLVVQSDDLKLGLTETWDGYKVLDRLDKILERAGIH